MQARCFKTNGLVCVTIQLLCVGLELVDLLGDDKRLSKDDGRKDSLGEVHVDSGRDDSIIPSVGPVAHVVWESSTNILDHASEEVNLPP